MTYDHVKCGAGSAKDREDKPANAQLGVSGLPQSATGQAILLTGKNIPAELSYHYGPKPNREVAAYLKSGTLFSDLTQEGRKAVLLNAYPPRYFDGVNSGKRLYSSIPLAVTSAGIPLFMHDDLFAGRALSADFTGEGWRTMLGYADAPVMEPHQAGQALGRLAKQHDFSLFEYWASDYAGHGQVMETAVQLMEIFDSVLVDHGRAHLFHRNDNRCAPGRLFGFSFQAQAERNDKQKTQYSNPS